MSEYPPHDLPQPHIVITLPSELEPYKHDIRRMLDAMLYKLKVHHKKGRWEDLEIGTAVRLMESEIIELKQAIEGGNLLEIQMEAADVANFAMIIASIATERGK